MRMLASAKGRAVFLKLHMPVRDWTNKCLSETGQTSRRAKGSQSHKSYESQKLGSRAASSSSSPLLLLLQLQVKLRYKTTSKTALLQILEVLDILEYYKYYKILEVLRQTLFCAILHEYMLLRMYYEYMLLRTHTTSLSHGVIQSHFRPGGCGGSPHHTTQKRGMRIQRGKGHSDIDLQSTELTATLLPATWGGYPAWQRQEQIAVYKAQSSKLGDRSTKYRTRNTATTLPAKPRGGLPPCGTDRSNSPFPLLCPRPHHPAARLRGGPGPPPWPPLVSTSNATSTKS